MTPTKTPIPLAALLTSIFLAGCATYPRTIHLRSIYYEHPPIGAQSSDLVSRDDLSVKFFGTGCCLIRKGDAAVLTDPFFSHYSFLRTAFGKLKPDPDEISKAVGEINHDLDGVRQLDVFISHSHYDHIAGLHPALEAGLHRPVNVYGSRTAKHILNSQGIQDQPEVAFHTLATEERPKWFTVKRSGETKIDARVHPITHPPHLKALGRSITLADEHLTATPERPPAKRGDYALGDTFGFEFRFTSNTPPYSSQRIYIVTSSSLPNSKDITTWPSPGVDLLITGASLWESSPDGDDYPGKLLQMLKPKDVALIHYNNLFKPRDSDPTPFVESSGDYKKLIRVIHSSWISELEESKRPNHRLITPGIGATIKVSQ